MKNVTMQALLDTFNLFSYKSTSMGNSITNILIETIGYPLKKQSNIARPVYSTQETKHLKDSEIIKRK